MFGKPARMTPLASRKQLLVAESERNRAQLAREWGAMTAGVRTCIGRAKSFGAIVSAAALLGAGLAAFRRTQSVPADGKPSWWQILLKGAGMLSTLWLAFRAKGRDQENQKPQSRA